MLTKYKLFVFSSIFLFSFALYTNSSYAATYYVSKTGSDSNPGTQAQPWLTVQKAANTMIAGDGVIVGDGRYDEIVVTKVAGNSGKPITFTGSGNTIMQSFGIYHEYNYIDKFKFTETITQPNYIYAAITFTAGNIRITNNTIYNLHHTAIKTVNDSGIPPAATSWPSNVYIGYNNINHIDTVSTAMLVTMNSSIIERNLFDYNASDTINLWGDNNIIRNNIVTNTQRDTINQGLNENHNDFIQTWGVPGYHALNNIIEANYIKGNYFQLFMLSEDGLGSSVMGGWIFRNNVWIDNLMNGNPGIYNTKWYNNTFYHSPYSPGSYSPLPFYNETNQHSAGGIIRNNLFVNCGYKTPQEGLKIGYYGVGFDADYNLVVGMPPYYDATYSAPSFSEVHGLNGVDPMFVDPANNDFRLRPGSPAIGVGTPLSDTFTTDYTGAPRGSVWDIGAYEYVSGGTSDTTPPSIPTGVMVQ